MTTLMRVIDADVVKQDVLRDFLGVLHQARFRDLRARLAEEIRTANFPISDFGSIKAFVNSHRAFNIYVGVAERATPAGRNRAACHMLRVMFVDIDFKDIPEDEARTRLAVFPLPPSIIVFTGGGLHVYWILLEPIDLQTPSGPGFAKMLLQALAKMLGGDMKAAEPARILRVPGTLNHKYDPPRPVIVEAWHPDRQYDLKAFTIVPLEEKEPERDRTPIKHNVTRDARLRLASLWVEQQPPAIERQGGNAHTYYVCCAVANDFDLDENDAFTVLKEWNAGCKPPWKEPDLRRELRCAATDAKSPRGARLIPTQVGAVSMLRGIRGIR